jgi:predicted transcriptional regulator of viral defense system
MGESSNPDLVAVASRAPRSVVCLVSALSFHNLTTQIPSSTSIAVLYGDTIPKIDYPPVSVHRFREQLFGSGITDEIIDGVAVKIYNPEKTLADCFKFRNKLGMDVVLEALKLYWERNKPDIGKILEYAKICRVEKVMTPYLESKL